MIKIEEFLSKQDTAVVLQLLRCLRPKNREVEKE
jgi:hypothetical protein